MRRIAVVALCLIASTQANANLEVAQCLPDGKSFSAYLVSYLSDGLKVHAMIAVPNSDMPERGYPVVIANHGYVPDPRQYGIGADGVDSRPGDYYRSVPELYAARGFMVVMPDYRGHNSSEGFEQIEGQDRAALQDIVGKYAADVVSLLAHLGDIPNADLDEVFMWSHSMGGGVSMRVLLKTDVIKAAAFWSTMDLTDLSMGFHRLGAPVIIQHAKGDRSSAYTNSVGLANALDGARKAALLHLYDAGEHFFEPSLRESAADKDADFFLSH